LSTYEGKCNSDIISPSKKYRKDTITVNVYCGGRNSYQVEPFQLAFQQLSEAPEYKLDEKWYYKISGKNVVVDYLFLHEMREANCNCPDLVEWLLKCDIHFIINHVHQGNQDWNIEEVLCELEKLHGHPGFPSGLNLNCPAFTQDKYNYIKAMMQPMTTEEEEDYLIRWGKRFSSYSNRSEKFNSEFESDNNVFANQELSIGDVYEEPTEGMTIKATSQVWLRRMFTVSSRTRL
jgi:hypothetical protein